MLAPNICQKARLSRDPRFDGQFFTAVKTTRIYCRSICPASVAKESNVAYYPSAIEAAAAGYRPCLRCRPDSAPGSHAWKGVDTTLERAMRLIVEGALQDNSLSVLAERLGIGDRYLRKLFHQRLGLSPKAYALYQQCLFAKQLLHQTNIPITQVALASGFNSVRRFNDCFRAQLGFTPSQVRKASDSASTFLRLHVYFRPPYNWSRFYHFLQSRVISDLEWCDKRSYGRTFTWLNTRGYFTAYFIKDDNKFEVEIEIDDLQYLKPVVNNIRRILDVDADIEAIENSIKQALGKGFVMKTGLRLPGTWNLFEAGVRAILGQQVSVKTARNLVSQLVAHLGESIEFKRLFPTPSVIADSNLGFLSMPEYRKSTLRSLARFYCEHEEVSDSEMWLDLKGIGPWTVDYAKLRGLSHPDIYLAGDLSVRKAVAGLCQPLIPERASPWRSYLTIQLWSQM